jgi:hypothetical protein
MMTLSVDTHQPLSLLNEFITEVATVKEEEIMHTLRNVNFHLPKPTWLQSLLSANSREHPQCGNSLRQLVS